jgi:hypothetical protein
MVIYVHQVESIMSKDFQVHDEYERMMLEVNNRI